MASDLRLAVIGAGVIGRTHIDTVSRCAGARVAAIVEPGPQGIALATELGVAHHGDMEALIAAGGIDGAIVATPNATHLPIAAALMAAGIPVLLEKPVAESLLAAAQLVALTRTQSTPLLVGHHRRHNPIVKTARQAIQQGRIGDLVVANVVTTLMKPASYFTADWRRSPGSGGPLLINLIHEIDMIRHFFGEVAEVQAMSSSGQRGFAVEDSAAVTLRLVSGGLVVMTISDAAAGPWAWDVTAGENPGRLPSHPVSAHHYAGTVGGLSLPDLTLWLHPAAPDWTAEMIPQWLTVTPADPYVAQILHFLDVIAGRAAPLISAHDGAANIACTEAIIASARSGKVCLVDLSTLG